MHSQTKLREHLDRYAEALEVRSKVHATSNELVEQDGWYRTTLRDLLQQRKTKKDGSFMTKQELLKLMQWKLARGKWRPRLEQYIEGHSEQAIINATRASFAAIDELSDQSAKEPIPRDTLRKLTQLKGVGPATASAVLAAYVPDRVPFLSDEAAVGVGSLGSKPDYTEAFFDRYTIRMHERVSEEGWASVDELECACYAAGIIEKYGSKDDGQKRREEGKMEDAKAVIEKAKTSATSEQRTAKGARPDAATAHGDDPVGEHAQGEPEGKKQADQPKSTTASKAGSRKPSSGKGTADDSSGSKKRKSTEVPREGERKSARLSSR